MSTLNSAAPGVLHAVQLMWYMFQKNKPGHGYFGCYYWIAGPGLCLLHLNFENRVCYQFRVIAEQLWAFGLSDFSSSWSFDPNVVDQKLLKFQGGDPFYVHHCWYLVRSHSILSFIHASLLVVLLSLQINDICHWIQKAVCTPKVQVLIYMYTTDYPLSRLRTLWVQGAGPKINRCSSLTKIG